MPKAKQLPDRTPYQIDGPASVLVLPDIHVPYHDMTAVQVALAWGKKRKPTHILLNGDFIDFEAVSAWDGDPADRNLKVELDTAKEMLRHIRSVFPKQPIIYKEGNHDERLRKYIWKHAPELSGLPSITLPELLEFDEIGITCVGDKKKVRLGALTVFHGHEYRTPMTNPVNPARGLFLRAITSSLCSHYHQRSEHSEPTADGKLITTWSTGCLCQLSPNYQPYGKWCHGFAFVQVKKDGVFDVLNPRIIKGNVYT